MRQSSSLARRLLLCVASAVSLALPACGGGGGGPGPDGAGQGLELVTFIQNGVANVPLNEVLEFRFSEPVDPATINVSTLQVRRGPGFGQAVFGQMQVSGSTVLFFPQLPGLCDLSDSGFQPARNYRVTLVGYPEQFPIRNTVGQPLRSSMNFEFGTRASDTALWRDGIPAQQPVLVAALNESGAPVDGVAAVPVVDGNELVLSFSENLDPCTISDSTVRFFEYQRGNPLVFNAAGGGRSTGFTPAADADPSPLSWGSIDPGEVDLAADPQRIRAILTLQQTFQQTLLRVTPEFGRFPENALCVLELTFGLKDLAGSTLVPVYVAFTTENLPAQTGQRVLTFETGSPRVLVDQSTADVNTARSPGRAQGWMLFSGDGDNGSNQLLPSLPNQPSACTTPRQLNDGTKDDFDPSADVRLDTGLSANTCNNVTDGSRAVVWEFRTLRIRQGRTVRIVGVNPAIILVQGQATIESGGRILARGDGLGGTSTNQGENGVTAYNQNRLGGIGYAGGGAGGLSYGLGNSTNNSEPGVSGFGSPGGYGVPGGAGAGGGGAHATLSGFATGGNSNGGGGGGHATAGGNGGSVARTNNPFKTTAMGTGGTTYPAMGGDSMPTLTAGSGGGGSGYNYNTQGGTFAGYSGSGGGGGAGGGAVDITASGDIDIFGTIDASGGRGGSGASGFYAAGGGAGGGSGGGIRLLTPSSIDISGATITAAGGVSGGGIQPGGGGATINNGGAGGLGRVVMEDGDSIITGQGAVTTMIPGEGQSGFYRGVFNAARFQGGGLEPQMVSDVFFCSPANPTYIAPVVADMLAELPAGASRGADKTLMLIEARGYNLKADGSYDSTTPTGWFTVGHFRDSGVGSAPAWYPSANPPVGDIVMPSGNVGTGFGGASTREFIQLRITFYLPSTFGPFDPGPLLDEWTIRFTYDQ